MKLLVYFSAFLVASATFVGVVPAKDTITVSDRLYFEKKIRPLLHKHCYECHSGEAKTIQGGLRLDTSFGIRAGGDSGPVLIPGKPEESLLVAAIQYEDPDYQMPPRGRLADHEIAELISWIKRGAPFPKSAGDSQVARPTIDYTTGRSFWSFQPVQQHDLPNIQHDSWPRERSDWFVLSKMERVGLAPSPEPSREVLLRRLSFDLTGLPPTAEEVQTFLDDTSSNAYDRQVTRLLESPRFGERWARHWLDLVRYTDQTASWLNSTGQAHLYRDWVVKALNEDMPYDEFVRRQLATDMLKSTGPADYPALGLLGLSPTYWKELKLPSEIIKVIVADEWEERVDVVSRTFLGLTVACARCHDHKFDPISSEDYYALAGVFASTRFADKPIIDEATYAPVAAAKKQIVELNSQLAKLEKQKPAPQDQIQQLRQRVTELKQTPHFDTPLANGVTDASLFVERAGKTPQEGTKLVYQNTPRDLHLFIRGNPNRLGPIVPRRFLRVLANEDAAPYRLGSGRLELANSITQDAASLTARVIVNRIWREHFGRGIVETPSNFGKLGTPPSHPHLLDDLAARFIANGWSMKWLHREIVRSATYRQSSAPRADQQQQDPDNRWLSRMNRRRLDVEAWRDAMLYVSGELDETMGGPSLQLESQNNRRRTLYATIHRREMSKTLQIHDFPDPTSHSPQRVPTTTPLQGLYLLNSPFVAARAQALAQSLSRAAPGQTAAQIQQAHLRLFARNAEPGEIELGVSFLGEHANDPTSVAWKQYAHALLGCNEFLFVD